MMNRNHIERLFKEHYAWLHGLAGVLLHDNDLARDVVNDVFEKLLCSDQMFEPTAGYLAAAVQNRCLNIIRDADVRRRLSELYFLELEDYDREDWPDEAEIARIYSIIGSELTPQCRRVMELRYVDGHKFTEIARMLGISETAVYKHVRHALTIIRKNLDNHG